MTAVLPPGPFPPRSLEEDGAVDLAVRLWTDLFPPGWLAGEGRVLLEHRLASAVDAGEWERAALLQAAFLDSWPLAAGVESAGLAWRAHADPRALVIIARAALVVQLARGWGSLPGAPWCLPDAAWVRERLGGEPFVVQARAHNDGSAELAQLLGCELRGQPGTPDGVLDVAAQDLVSQRAQLAGSLSRGELQAVLVRGEPTPSAASQLALGELRLEGSHQRAVERFGLSALELDPSSAGQDWSWEDDGLLDAPSPGRPGPVLVACCEGRFIPGPPSALRAGRPQRVGVLLWDAPVRPVMVAPVAVAVANALDGVRDSAAVAASLGGPLDQVQLILEELLALGAVSASG